jgi:hypothetical protein
MGLLAKPIVRISLPIADLQRRTRPRQACEGVVYRHLNELQGELVPVYLGNISLARPYFLHFRVRIVHMLLILWAGEQAQKDLMSSIGRNINEETTRVGASDKATKPE